MGNQADWEDRPTDWSNVNYGGNPNIKTLDPNMPYVQDNPDFRAGSRGALLGIPNNRNNTVTAATSVREYQQSPGVVVNDTSAGLDWMHPALSLMQHLGAKVPEQAVPPAVISGLRADGVNTKGGVSPIDIKGILMGSRVNPQNVAARQQAAAQPQAQPQAQPSVANHGLPAPINLPELGGPRGAMQQAQMDPSVDTPPAPQVADQMPPTAPDFQRPPAPMQAPGKDDWVPEGQPISPQNSNGRYDPNVDGPVPQAPPPYAPQSNGQAAFGSPYRVQPPDLHAEEPGFNPDQMAAIERGRNAMQDADNQEAIRQQYAKRFRYDIQQTAGAPDSGEVSPMMAKAESYAHGGAPVASQQPEIPAPPIDPNVRNHIGQRIFRPLQGGVQQQDLTGTAGDTTLRNGVQQTPLRGGVDTGEDNRLTVSKYYINPDGSVKFVEGAGRTNTSPEMAKDIRDSQKEVEKTVRIQPTYNDPDGAKALTYYVHQSMMRKGYRVDEQGRLTKSSRARLGAG